MQGYSELMDLFNKGFTKHLLLSLCIHVKPLPSLDPTGSIVLIFVSLHTFIVLVNCSVVHII